MITGKIIRNLPTNTGKFLLFILGVQLLFGCCGTPKELVREIGNHTQTPVNYVAIGQNGSYFSSRSRVNSSLLKDIQRWNTNDAETDILAWALKTTDTDPIPDLLEEAIIIYRMTNKKWSICYLERFMCGNAYVPWKEAADNTLATSRDFNSYPSEEQICKFILSTNFGMNEYSDRKPFHVGVLNVFLYRDSAEILKTLMSGIPEKLKQERHNAELQYLVP